jgi:hypothetical protein
MQLLADRLVELGVVETISDETVRRALKNVWPAPSASRFVKAASARST